MRINDRCCCCDGIDMKSGERIHVEQVLYNCLNPKCSHQCCEKHRELCGFCTCCCAELHGLNFHDREKL
jgi:hypothetical protein